MSKQDKPTLKGYFNTDDQPNESQFHDLIDSFEIETLSTQGDIVNNELVINFNQKKDLGVIDQVSDISIVLGSNNENFNSVIFIINTSGSHTVNFNINNITIRGDLLDDTVSTSYLIDIFYYDSQTIVANISNVVTRS